MTVLIHIPQFHPHFFVRPRNSLWANSKFRIFYLGAAYYILAMFLIPFVSLLILNILLIRTVRQANDAIRLDNNTRPSNRSDTSDVTKVVTAIISVFLFSYLPYMSVGILQIAIILDRKVIKLTYQCSMQWFYYFIVIPLPLVNSSVNFIIYFVLRKSYRKMLREILSGSHSSRYSVSSGNSGRTIV